MKSKNETTRYYNKFQYHLEDTRCCDCLYYIKKRGCSLTACCCRDIKLDAIANSRIKRKRGSMTWDM